MKKLVVVLGILLLTYVGCKDQIETTDANKSVGQVVVNINTFGSVALNSDSVYTAWINCGNNIKLGNLTPDANNASLGNSYDVSYTKLYNATNMFITKEAKNKDTALASTPSTAILLSGRFNGNSAKITTKDTVEVGNAQIILKVY